MRPWSGAESWAQRAGLVSPSAEVTGPCQLGFFWNISSRACSAGLFAALSLTDRVRGRERRRRGKKNDRSEGGGGGERSPGTRFESLALPWGFLAATSKLISGEGPGHVSHSSSAEREEGTDDYDNDDDDPQDPWRHGSQPGQAKLPKRAWR